ncbi:MAG: hypothetical protein H0W34_14915 [Pyrinomonadaceae bacterium]|nr:hypothetical protein [Pyrinomonadaceae bacterium]
MMSESIDRKRWPFEVEIKCPDGSREYHQQASDNGDGTVTVNELHFPEGYVERTYPVERAKLRQRPWEKAEDWYQLYDSVYGDDGRLRSIE